MDDLQDRLVRVGLATLIEHGFALAGGYALQAHGLTDRLSEDVDRFTDRWDTAAFSRAVDGEGRGRGFTTGWFAEALAGVDRFSDEQFTRYGVGPR